VAFTMAGIAAGTLLAAVTNTPLGEWSNSNYLFGAILVLFIVAFAIAGIRDRFNVAGRYKGKTILIISIIGTAAAVLAIAGSLLSGEWNLDSILTAGTWLALLVMFGAAIPVARQKMASGE
jgi:hypothetical protein